MRNFSKIFICISICLIFVFLSSCSPVDNDYGVSSEVDTKSLSSVEENNNEMPIMSSDRVMSKYFDISLFDEENYANIYLGKKFKIDAQFLDQELSVPTKLSDLKDKGWSFADGNNYDENSLVFAYETIDIYLVNEANVKLHIQLYNSSRSSVSLSECYVVKYIIENNFYKDNVSYNKFNVNGITNTMAITDIIDTLGTPSHFYKVSDTSYYLDYFITKKDRRNGITIYINPIDDLITSIEFSYYK